MSAQPGSAATQQDQPKRLAITPVPGSLLDQLLDQERAAAAAVREAEDRRKSARARIERELTMAHPGIGAFDIAGSQHRPGMHLTWVETVRMDVTRLKAEQPVTYVEYAVFGGRWELRADRGLG